MRRSLPVLVLAASLTAPSFAAHDAVEAPVFTGARAAAPVVLTGAQVPEWSRLAAQGVAKTYPSGSALDGVRHAHNGVLTVPPDSRAGVNPDHVAAFRWNGTRFVEVPVQVDQRFPYFLANARSSFGVYSGTDEELTYAWAPDGHSTGEEAWKKMFGTCAARYATPAENAALPAHVTPAPAGSLDTAGYTGPMQDPVPTLDDDDEIVVMARDAGPQAPPNAPLPRGAIARGQTIRIADPLDPANVGYVYLFRRLGGSSFDAATSPYVRLVWNADANEWIDRYAFAPDDPEKLGSSNTGYGPNLPGTVCRTDPRNGTVTAPDGTPRASADRFPRDGMTVTTPTYRLTATGRWMVRDLQVTREDSEYDFGPDLVSRWKGRAFQQSPDSVVSLVGFEDEQVNWEANSVLLGWRAGPVRAIREVWGADSGTNVTKTELFYRDADVFNYHVRVHPIPPDGLYTSWNYNPGAVDTYFTTVRSEGVPIDGMNDELEATQVDEDPVARQPMFFDTCDPTLDVCSPTNRPEQVAGPHGGLVYQFEITSPPTALAGNFNAVPYYRDDLCLDDGTGDSPVPRPWPGEASGDARVRQGYVDYWKAHGAPAGLTYTDLVCAPDAPPGTPEWQRAPFAGAYGQHGLHFFATQDSDNAWLPKPATELNGQQWRFSVPMSEARNVLADYSPNVSAKLTGVVTPYGV